MKGCSGRRKALANEEETFELKTRSFCWKRTKKKIVKGHKFPFFRHFVGTTTNKQTKKNKKTLKEKKKENNCGAKKSPSNVSSKVSFGKY